MRNGKTWKTRGLRSCTFTTVLSYQDTGEKRFTIVSSCNRSQLLLQRPQEGEFQKPTVKNLRKLCHVRARVKLSLSKWRDGKSSLEPQTALKLLLQKSYHGRDLL